MILIHNHREFLHLHQMVQVIPNKFIDKERKQGLKIKENRQNQDLLLDLQLILTNFIDVSLKNREKNDFIYNDYIYFLTYYIKDE